MKRLTASFAFAAFAALGGSTVVGSAFAQESGGTLQILLRGNPPSGSVHEEATNTVTTAYSPVFNNLVVFDPNDPVNKAENIQPELATSWSLSSDAKTLTFQLREGVTWHDGQPFTAADVKCTWDTLIGANDVKLRKHPRKSWYWNLKSISAEGDHTVSFHLGQPQPSLLSLLASGYSPVYPCHVSPEDMRKHPIGTGPFKFEDFKKNELVKLVRNENYWKDGLPYMDGIDWTIIGSRATRTLAFIAGDFDMTFNGDLKTALMRDVMEQAPDAICEMVPTGVHVNLIVNSEVPPFDNLDLRRAMALSIDRQAFVDILSEGAYTIGTSMQPGPDGVWAMPEEMQNEIPGYGGDVEASRAQARDILAQLGHGPDNPLKINVSTRNFEINREPAIILIDHLKTVGIEASLEVVESANWFAKIARKDYSVGLNLTGRGVDEPDVDFFENYACGSQRNYTGYCNPELQTLFEKQSSLTDLEERKALVWQIDQKLQMDVARPVIFHSHSATCWHPQVKGVTMNRNSTYNGWRFEDVWLDR